MTQFLVEQRAAVESRDTRPEGVDPVIQAMPPSTAKGQTGSNYPFLPPLHPARRPNQIICGWRRSLTTNVAGSVRESQMGAQLTRDDIDPGQTNFGDLITSLLADFASSSGSQIDDYVERGLAQVGSFIGADYAVVVQVSSDMATWSVTHEWCGAGIPSRIAEYQNVPFGTFE